MKQNKLFLFFRIQLKSALLLLPKLLFILCFSLLFAYGILTAGKELMNRPDSVKLPVALVLPENDTYAGLAFSFIERMDSIRATCSFQRTDQDTALDLLKSRNVYAVILIPDSFVEHILNGTNSAATLILPKEGSVESILFCTLANAGTSALSTAQAGIYAVEDVLISYEKWDKLPEAEEKLNKLYLSYALNRNKMFKTETISAIGSLTITEYFICSAIILFLLLSGMGSYHYFQAEPDSLRLIMDRQGISPCLRISIKLLAVTAIYALFLFPLMVIMGLLPITALGGFFLFTFAIQSFLFLLSSLCSQSGSYIIVSAVLSMLFLFLSGAFIPSVFLPEAVRDLGTILPSAIFLKLCRELITGTFSLISAIQGILVSVLFLILSFIPKVTEKIKKACHVSNQ